MSGEKTVLGIGELMLVIWMAIVGCWVTNVVELVGCKWNHPEGNWKNEIVHGIGLLGPAALVTVWFPNKMEK